MTVTHTKRALVLGDSISSIVYDDTLAPPDCNKLWVHQLSHATGINIQSLSAPGNRITVGTAADASLRYNSNAFNLMRGVELPAFVIITAGTNDYGGADTRVYSGTWNFISDYRWILAYWKYNAVPVLCVSPLWRSDEATKIAHPDGPPTGYELSDYRSWIYDLSQETTAEAQFMSHTCFGLTSADFVQDTPTLKLHMNGDGHDKFAAGMLLKLGTLGWL